MLRRSGLLTLIKRLQRLSIHSHSSTSGWYYPRAWDLSPYEENEEITERGTLVE